MTQQHIDNGEQDPPYSLPGSPSVTVDPNTNRITDTGFHYDAAGNMDNDGVHAYTFDAENRLVVVDSTAATYVYGPDGLRIKKTVGSSVTTYIFSGFKVLAEYTGSTPALSQEYIYAGGSLLASLNSSGTPTYRHMDHLSARLETDASGNVTRTFGHYPYGETWYENTSSSKWKFTTYERDSESQLDYADARFFIPRLGRFLTGDPLAGSIGDPQSLGRYAYTTGDPINFSDPTGMDRCGITSIEQRATCLLLAWQDYGPAGGGPAGGGGCNPWIASCGGPNYNPNIAISPEEQAYGSMVMAGWFTMMTTPPGDGWSPATGTDAARDGCWVKGDTTWCPDPMPDSALLTGFTIFHTAVDHGYCNWWCEGVFNNRDSARIWNSAATWGNTAAGLTFAVVGANGALIATPALVTSYQLGQGALLNPTVLEFGTDAISGMTPATAVPATWGGFAGATTGEAFTYAVCRWGDRC